MPARIYTAPEEIGDPPEIDFSAGREEGESIDAIFAPEREWEETVKAWCREFGKGELAGEEWRYPRGDGYARYVVYTEKPLALIHLTTGDAWSIDEITRKGLNLTDLRKYISGQKRIAALFSSNKGR
jgi:hypothetical protein